MSSAGKPWAKYEAEFKRAKSQVDKAKAAGRKHRDILLGYAKQMRTRKKGKTKVYTAKNVKWIGTLVADCRTEKSACQNASRAEGLLDESRPLVSAACSYARKLGQARDRVKKLRKEQKEAWKKLSDCLKKNGRCGKARVGHGNEGVPCFQPLGPDGSCQYHP